MEINERSHGRLTGKGVEVLSRMLDYRSVKHQTIAGNLANVETPGYRPKALTFDEELRKAADKSKIRLKTTNPKHLGNDLSLGGKAAFEIRTKAEPYRRPDDLNIDREIAEMLQNNVLYEATVRLLAKRFTALKMAIDAGRR
jgi:flagellar basal-body rod protein FlgB